MSLDGDLRAGTLRLARAHARALGPPTRASLAARVDALEHGFAGLYERLGSERYAPGERPLAIEWLLDNGHVIQDALEQVRTSLPPGFLARLPTLTEASSAGATRVEALAAFVAGQPGGPLAPDVALETLEVYQETSPLSVGELWAFPAMLRLAVLENMAPAARATLGRGQDAPGGAGRDDDATVAQGVRALRQLAAEDWETFFERASLLERTLREDPSGAYPRMDFATRDRYRQAVERLARDARAHDELAVGRAAVDLAAAGQPGGRDHHVGTYLIAEGRGRLEERIGFRASARLRLGRWLERRAGSIYVVATLGMAGLFLAIAVLWLASLGAVTGLLVALAVVGAVPAWSLASTIVDWLASLVVPARRVPRMDADVGVPSDARTMVVVPVILSSVPEIEPLLDRLEANFLGNRDPNVTFALLTDLADAPVQQRPGDAELEDVVADGIRRLNARHGRPDALRPFHLFHRERRWNPVERTWMGWERKRGKLEEFNALVTGRGATSFYLQVDAPDDLHAIRYVLTLDGDTRLPPDAVRELVAAFRHPLVRPVIDPDTDELLAGYTVLQPRLETDPAGAPETTFARWMAGESGVDLYAHVVSNLHHDVFGHAIFMGKGLYDVDAFERRLRGRVPENRLLSHDLFEGAQGRVGMISDVALYEENPENALLQARRLHRWVRGDWQLLPWLFARHPQGREGRVPSGLRPIGRWAIADNLRRSLHPAALFALLAASWLLLPAAPAVWATLVILGLVAAPIVLAALASLGRGLVGGTPGPAMTGAAHAARIEARRLAISLVLLPHTALVTLDATALALYRLFVSGRGLLQWTTAAHAARATGGTLTAPVALRNMAGAWASTWVLAALLAWLTPGKLPVALPLLVAWALAPWLVAWTSRPSARPRELLTEPQRRTLRLLARRTWYFFNELVGPRDHWLPPDHIQEDPGPVVARRTSPTNIGMMLGSTLGAYDLGFIEARTLANRVRETLDTLDRLERHRGHWLNWYGTNDLAPLEPRYVSVVDSGNLAAALLVVARGLEDARHDGVPYPPRVRGVGDTVAVLETVLGRLRTRLVEREGRRQLDAQRAALADLEVSLRLAANRPVLERRDAIDRAGEVLREVAQRVTALLEKASASVPHGLVGELRAWLDQAQVEARAARSEIDATVPWLDLVVDPPEGLRRADAAAIDTTWRQLTEALAEPLDLREIHELASRARSLVQDLGRQLDARPPSATIDAARAWGDDVLAALERAMERAAELDADLSHAAARCRRAAEEMDFGFLYDRERRLFHLGLHLTAGTLDPNHYDLLASEARTASLVAIAKGDVPTEHWLQLGRPLARVRGARALLSWSGTMFEYLMPRLFLRHPERTLLYESCHTALAQQIAFGQTHGVPWGVSESAFAELGVQGDYQYRAFGVPGVGLKRDLGQDLVIAPYATLLALPLRPRQAMANVERLTALGAMGRYGLIDALDYGEVAPAGALIAGRRRWRRGGRTVPLPEAPLQQPHLVRTYMAHHQGMILMAATNQLLDDRMVRRLHAEPSIASVELLLHERIPTHVPPPSRWRRAEAAAAEPGVQPPTHVPQWTADPRGRIDQAMPLSNGAMSTLVRAAGGGGSHWGGITLTRDQSRETGGARGMLVYLRDLDDGEVWTTSLDPTGGDPSTCEVTFAAHGVRYQRRRGDLLVRDQVVVADRDPLLLRQVTLTNTGDRPRRVAVASYAEVVLGNGADDARHPAFAKLFVESTVHPGADMLTFRRRPRAPYERGAVLGHRMVLDGAPATPRSACTDRRAFIGRGGDLRAPLAPTLYPEPGTGAVVPDLVQPTPVRSASASPAGATPSREAAATLDPIASLGTVLELAPGASAHVTFVTASAPSEEAVAGALRRAESPALVRELIERAEAAAAVELRGLGIEGDDLPALTDLLSLAHAPRAGLRRSLAEAGPVLPALWSQGVSGDLPIVVVRVTGEDDLPFVVRVLRGHTWWRGRQVGVDLLLLDETSSGYEQPMRDRLEGAIAEVGRLGRGQGPGRATVLVADRSGDRLNELLAAGAVVLDASGPSLAEQLARGVATSGPLPDFVPVPGPLPPAAEIEGLRPLAAPGFGGLGGFAGELGTTTHDEDAADVVLHLEPGQTTPAPWINVIANERFGFLVGENGASTTWGANSGEQRLTPWPNDPVRNPTGEALYLRDEETGAVWSPTPDPAPGGGAYRVRHGAGVTVFDHRSHGLDQTFSMFVDTEASVKYLTLRLRDHWQRPRRLTVTAYVEWVLGTSRARQAPFILPDYDAETGTLSARTLLGPMAGSSVAFLSASRPPHGLTTDRREFLGPDLDAARPDGLRRVGLSGSVQPGVDPCAALQVHVDLEPGGVTELHFVLGLAEDRAAALEIVRRCQTPDAPREALERVRRGWRERLGQIIVHTPDPEIDHVLNRWLPYQAIACRLWGRTALYQSSGAYGFRDQLQDAVNLASLDPGLLRAQLLRAAARQFEAGDVLHWWHPESDAGVRTRFSDDLLWLPWACARYLERTEDESVLHERVPYLHGRPLAENEEERYDTYRPGDVEGTLLDHALRALERGDTRGPHGLPLIGGGDWNDGMNRLGLKGRGESVWLAWFLTVVLEDGANLCSRVGDAERAARFRARRAELVEAIEAHAWDGAWYRRAFADDGSPIGSAQRDEARIDLIAQAWSVLSGAGDPARAVTAMASAKEHLWRRDEKLFLLLTPPFQHEEPDPGYIRAYPPGVRENGGQYTHGGIWGAWALADLGEGDAAVELLRTLGGTGRADTAEDAERYRVEPYVVAADVYDGDAAYRGRGGWTWYTGSAGWLYRYGLERVLGVRPLANRLVIDPCIAADWPGFAVTIRHGGASYEIVVENPDGVHTGVAAVRLDGEDVALEAGVPASVPWRDDGEAHRVEVRLGRAHPALLEVEGRAP